MSRYGAAGVPSKGSKQARPCDAGLLSMAVVWCTAVVPKMLRRAAAPANQLCFSVLLSGKRCFLASRPRPHLFTSLKCLVSAKKNARGLLGQRVSWRQVRPHPFPTHSRFPEPRIENFTFIKQPQWFQPVCCKGPSVFNCPKCTGAGRRLPGVSANPWS